MGGVHQGSVRIVGCKAVQARPCKDSESRHGSHCQDQRGRNRVLGRLAHGVPGLEPHPDADDELRLTNLAAGLARVLCGAPEFAVPHHAEVRSEFS